MMTKSKLVQITQYIYEVKLRYLPQVLVSLLTLILSFFVVHNANWVFGDEFNFLKTTAVGEYIALNQQTGVAGRFWPLGQIDYNLLVLFNTSGSALAHYCWVAINFVIFTLVSFFVIRKIILKSVTLTTASWLGFFGMLLLVSRFYPMFLNLIFPERIILVLLSVFIYLYYQFVQTNQIKYGILSFLIAVYLSYCKEPLSGMFAVMALTHLFFNYKQLSKTHRIFYIGLLVNFIVFIVLYYFIVFQSATGFYGQAFVKFSKLELIVSVFRSHKVFVFAAILAIYRLYFLFFKKEREHLLFDSLLFAAFAYIVVLLLLNMKNTYYYFPAVLLAYVVLIYFVSTLLKKELIVFGIFALSTMIVSVKIPGYIKQNQLARKDTMPKIEKLAELVKSGKNLYWFDEPAKKDDEEYRIMTDWQRIVIESFIGYVLKDGSSYKMKINSGLELLTKGDILFYSHYCDSGDRLSTVVATMISVKRMEKMDSIEQIDFFQIN